MYSHIKFEHISKISLCMMKTLKEYEDNDIVKTVIIYCKEFNKHKVAHYFHTFFKSASNFNLIHLETHDFNTIYNTWDKLCNGVVVPNCHLKFLVFSDILKKNKKKCNSISIQGIIMNNSLIKNIRNPGLFRVVYWEKLKLSPKQCQVCFQKIKKRFQCKDCNLTSYCSKECQKKHLSVHKLFCQNYYFQKMMEYNTTEYNTTELIDFYNTMNKYYNLHCTEEDKSIIFHHIESTCSKNWDIHPTESGYYLFSTPNLEIQLFNQNNDIYKFLRYCDSQIYFHFTLDKNIFAE